MMHAPGNAMGFTVEWIAGLPVTSSQLDRRRARPLEEGDLERVHQGSAVGRLLEVVRSSNAPRDDGEVRASREQDHGNAIPASAVRDHPAHHLRAIDSRHLDVEQDDVRRAGSETAKTFLAISGYDDVVPSRPENLSDDLADVCVVLDNEKPRHADPFPSRSPHAPAMPVLERVRASAAGSSARS